MQLDFVVQIRPETAPAAGELKGRVEHIASGQSAHFDNPGELIAFMARCARAATDASADLTAV